jgi:cell division protein FtsB
MVTRPRIRAFFSALALYIIAALLIGYFGANAYSGKYGLTARISLEQQVAALTAELAEAKAERERWERRVALLKSDGLDPDMLDERARALLGYADPRDVVSLRKRQP